MLSEGVCSSPSVLGDEFCLFLAEFSAGERVGRASVFSVVL